MNETSKARAMVATEEEADYIVGHVVATHLFEGMHVTPVEQKMLKKLALGKISRDDYMKFADEFIKSEKEKNTNVRDK